MGVGRPASAGPKAQHQPAQTSKPAVESGRKARKPAGQRRSGHGPTGWASEGGEDGGV